MKFRPHTHALVFFPKRGDVPDLLGSIDAPDRSLKIKLNDEGQRMVYTEFKELRLFIPYMHGAYSLVSVYGREYTHEGVVELNTKTVHALRTLIELSVRDQNEPSYRRHVNVNIPKKEELEALTRGRQWKHPLLRRRGRPRRNA